MIRRLGVIVLMLASCGGNSIVDERISRHMTMCDGIENEQLKIECYEGVPSEHELING